MTGEPASRPLRGQIWEFDLNPKKGREQRGVRPCVVISHDALNRSDFGTVIVCPITTRQKSAFRWRPGLTPQDLEVIEPAWEARPHWIMTDQIVTVDARHRALRLLATIVRQERVGELDDSLRLILALR
ncbi:MAG: type II toxin-antitoxin system PemK/MazF family toxin [Gemmatimonadota bacterium]